MCTGPTVVSEAGPQRTACCPPPTACCLGEGGQRVGKRLRGCAQGLLQVSGAVWDDTPAIGNTPYRCHARQIREGFSAVITLFPSSRLLTCASLFLPAVSTTAGTSRSTCPTRCGRWRPPACPPTTRGWRSTSPWPTRRWGEARTAAGRTAAAAPVCSRSTWPTCCGGWSGWGCARMRWEGGAGTTRHLV